MLASAGRSGQVKCPIAGCNASWTKAGASVDKELQYRMERYYRLQKMTSSTAEMHATFIKVDPDEEDDGYTQL